MKICVVGTGYVGLVTGACLAEVGNNVTCVDSDSAKIQALNHHSLPFYEAGLDELVAGNQKQGRLRFTTSLAEAACDSAIFFISVGTSGNGDGSVELTELWRVARELGKTISAPALVVIKSTVPVGTTQKIGSLIATELSRREALVDFDVASNPEFLKQGNAVNDFMRPGRIIIGVENRRAGEILQALYGPFTRNHERVLVMRAKEAEMVKYAANAMLATRISFMNEIANLCERMEIDVESVRRGIGSDSRIGYSSIYAGCGYGGSCLPKDMKALIHMAQESAFEPILLKAVEWRNERQKERLFEKIIGRFGRSLDGCVFALWGLSFKPNTDDMREAPSVVLLNQLIGAGARVKAYDPVAMEKAGRSLPRAWFESGQLTLTATQYAALNGADAMILLTEWKPFRELDLETMGKTMSRRIIFDGRNQYDPVRLRASGYEYFGIGR